MNDVEDRLIDLQNLVTKPIEAYEQIIKQSVIIDVHILDECFVRCEKTLEKEFVQDDLSQFKFAGAACFWIRKLKPFSLDALSSRHSTYLNEHIAFSIAYMFLFGYFAEQNRNKPRVSSAFMEDFVTFLRYNSASPHALILIFMAMSMDD